MVLWMSLLYSVGWHTVVYIYTYKWLKVRRIEPFIYYMLAKLMRIQWRLLFMTINWRVKSILRLRRYIPWTNFIQIWNMIPLVQTLQTMLMRRWIILLKFGFSIFSLSIKISVLYQLFIWFFIDQLRVEVSYFFEVDLHFTVVYDWPYSDCSFG